MSSQQRTSCDTYDSASERGNLPSIARSLASMPENDRSPFMELPGELRNKIYDFALTEEDELHVSELTGNDRLCITVVQTQRFTKEVESNQLQYVNKQIRAETKGYGLQLNSLHFATTHAEEPSPLFACANFLLEVRPYWIAKMSQIYICRTENFYDISDDIDFRAQAQLFTICGQNRHLTLHWKCPGWTLDNTLCRFAYTGVSIVYAYRGIDVLAPLGYPNWYRTYTNAWLERWPYLREAPKNFRVYPSSVHGRESLAALDRASERCGHHNELILEKKKELRKMILAWFEEGV